MYITENIAPIVLFAYNRPKHTENTLKALGKNTLAKYSDLYIFIDGAKNIEEQDKVDEVTKIARELDGFKKITIIKSDVNKGLANSIIDGVSKVIKKYNKVIVLEDDLITSQFFLQYMNDALDYYGGNDNIWSISGYSPKIDIPIHYNHDVYFTMRSSSWGWGTWIDRWKTIDWKLAHQYNLFLQNRQLRKSFNRSGNDLSMMLRDQMNGYIDSWAIRWCFNQFLQNKYTVYPTITFIKNEGLDNSGTHGSFKENRQLNFNHRYDLKFDDIQLDTSIFKKFASHYKLLPYNYVGFVLKRIGIYKNVKKLMKKIKEKV